MKTLFSIVDTSCSQGKPDVGMHAEASSAWNIRRILVFVILVVVLFIELRITTYESRVYAQAPALDIAETLTITDADAVDGDLVSLSGVATILTTSKKAYDDKLYGVLTTLPLMVYRTQDTIPVVRSGTVEVNVTTLKGPIKIGDYVTSSPIPGKAMSGQEGPGYMLGTAVSAFGETDGVERVYEGNTIREGRIQVSLAIGPAIPVRFLASGGILGSLKYLTTALSYNLRTTKEAERLIRYIIAAIVGLGTIVINFLTFGRNITKGLESLGRNPLAKTPIQSMIILNIVLIGVVSAGGIILALAIISL